MDNQLFRQTIAIGLNQFGSIIEPRLHDGLLTRIDLISDKQAELSIRDEDGVRFELSLRGLVWLKAADFREGNTILDVILHRGQIRDIGLLEEVLDLTPEEVKKHPAFFDDLLNRVRSGNLTLVELTPSYGCYLLALCQEVVAYRIS